MELYIARTKPYEKKDPLAFDLRGYASYVKDNHLAAKDITPEIMQQFQHEII